jgi:hypothetical protein
MAWRPERGMKMAGAIPCTWMFDGSAPIFIGKTSCEAVEFHRGCLGGIAEPTFRGFSFFGKSYEEIQGWLAARDPDLMYASGGFHSETFGVGIYAPVDSVESLIVFRKGYYDPIVKTFE